MTQKPIRQMRTIDGVTRLVEPKRPPNTLIRVLKKLRLLQFLAVLVVVIAVVLVAFFAPRLFKRPDQNSVAGVTAAVSKHLVLPKNEQPILATVTDKDSLKTPFLQEADNGDKILIYEKAKRVIIYRPSIDRIIDIGPVELTNIPKATQ